MFIETDELGELLKSLFPVYFIYLISIILVVSPVTGTTTSHEFPVYRMSQFDYQGTPRGCRSAIINLEARSTRTWSNGRHCVIARLDRLTNSAIIRIKETAGALLILLPRAPNQLTETEVQELTKVLSAVYSDDLSVPVYLMKWTNEVEKMIEEIDESLPLLSNVDSISPRSNAFDTIVKLISKNGYQVVISTPKPAPINDALITSIQGKLSGYGVEDKLPTIVIVAHYDAYSLAPELAFGAENNASGVAMLLELCRLLSLLYASSRSHGHVNIVFLLSGAGTISYIGSKKWLEDHLDSIDSTLPQDVQYVLCLDAVASPNLYMHVSKPPREGSALHNFFVELLNITDNNLQMIHKRINLAEDFLSWEHERFSIRRLPATTISSLKSAKELRKDGLFDVPEKVDIKSLTKNIEIIASAIARHIYNISSDHPSPFSNQQFAVSEDQVRAWIEFLGSHSRSPFVLHEKGNPLIRVLQDTLRRYLDDVKTFHHTAEKREPDFVFYDTTKATANIYNVKPSIFDLFITVMNVLFLTAYYLMAQYMPTLYNALVPSTNDKKLKNH